MVDDEIIRKYNENGLYCKEDLIFEMLMFIIRDIGGRGYFDVDEVEDAYRNAYSILPFHIELK